MSGTLYGVGLGPGDPELMTLKAARILQQAKIVAYFSKDGAKSHARTIASSILNGHHEEFPMVYPVTTEYPVSDPRYETLIGGFYEEISEALAARLAAGEDVAVICAGDPFLYGSFMHIYRRLAERFTCHVVPGIPSMVGCWTNAKTPITWGDDILTVLPGMLPASALIPRLQATDAAVIMKIGRNLPHVREALRAAGMYDRAMYVEYGTMQAERIMPLSELTSEIAPYFSQVIVPGNGRKL